MNARIVSYFRPAMAGPGHSSTRRSLSILRNKLRQCAQARAARREYREMLEFDDTILRDVGIDRSDLHWALRQPLSTDVTAELSARWPNRAVG